MKRRNFSAALLGTSLGATGLAVTTPAPAQGGAPVEGTHYVKLSQPLPLPAGGKIEVIEFFWYGCPHCNTFEPMLDAWSKRLEADVAFRRVPVAFREEPFVAHQRIFYALEALGQFEPLHRKVFYAIHVERARLDKPAEIALFMTKNGLDGTKFLDAFNSFSVQTKARQAKQLSEAYKIDGVPAIGVHGRYFTSGTLAGGSERALAVAEWLIQKVRQKA
jgi:thiol:disulfide interchange protein DsbA